MLETQPDNTSGSKKALYFSTLTLGSSITTLFRPRHRTSYVHVRLPFSPPPQGEAFCREYKTSRGFLQVK